VAPGDTETSLEILPDPGNVTPFCSPRSRKAGYRLLVRLTLKLANSLDGLDVTAVNVGDVIELSRAQAIMLIAEGWAEPVQDDGVGKLPRESNRQRAG
jgi:hypothetical protein